MKGALHPEQPMADKEHPTDEWPPNRVTTGGYIPMPDKKSNQAYGYLWGTMGTCGDLLGPMKTHGDLRGRMGT